MVNVRHGKTLHERKTDKSETKTQLNYSCIELQIPREICPPFGTKILDWTLYLHKTMNSLIFTF